MPYCVGQTAGNGSRCPHPLTRNLFRNRTVSSFEVKFRWSEVVSDNITKEQKAEDQFAFFFSSGVATLYLSFGWTAFGVPEFFVSIFPRDYPNYLTKIYGKEGINLHDVDVKLHYHDKKLDIYIWNLANPVISKNLDIDELVPSASGSYYLGFTCFSNNTQYLVHNLRCHSQGTSVRLTRAETLSYHLLNCANLHVANRPFDRNDLLAQWAQLYSTFTKLATKFLSFYLFGDQCEHWIPPSSSKQEQTESCWTQSYLTCSLAQLPTQASVIRIMTSTTSGAFAHDLVQFDSLDDILAFWPVKDDTRLTELIDKLKEIEAKKPKVVPGYCTAETEAHFLHKVTRGMEEVLQLIFTFAVRCPSPDTFCSDMIKAVNNPMASDIKFLLDDKTIYAHKIILKYRAPALFDIVHDKAEYGLEGIPLALFHPFLEFIYTGKLPSELQVVFIELVAKYCGSDGASLISDLSSSKPGAILGLWTLFRNDIDKMRQDTALTDIKFRVDEHVIGVNKAILMFRSPYFAKLLTSGMKESRLSEITLHDVTKDAFMKYVEHLYTGYVKELTGDDAVSLLCHCSFFLESRMLDMCQNLVQDAIELDNVIDLYLVAKEIAAEPIEYHCMAFMVTHFHDIIKHPSLKTLPFEDLERLYLKKDPSNASILAKQKRIWELNRSGNIPKKKMEIILEGEEKKKEDIKDLTKNEEVQKKKPSKKKGSKNKRR